MTANRQSVRMMAVMATTTAAVVAVPTPEALEPLLSPLRQPEAAMITPKTTLLVSPRPLDLRVRASTVWRK